MTVNDLKGEFMTKKYGIALLAAGKGTRLKLDCPKVLAPLLGQNLIDFIFEQIAQLEKKLKLNFQLGVVVGHKAAEVQAYLEKWKSQLDSHLQFCLQDQQLGTAHALQCFLQDKDHLKTDYTLILCGDTPLLTADLLNVMFERLEQAPQLDGLIASFQTAQPHGYGRILRLADHKVAIVEEKEASEEQKKITEVNSGVYLVKTALLEKFVKNINNKNQSGEYYLTDLFEQGNFTAHLFEGSEEFLGVNDQQQLQLARKILLNRKVQQLREQGVYIEDSDSLSLDWQVRIEKGAQIYSQAVLKGKTVIAQGARIGENCYIADSLIGQDCEILPFSHLQQVQVAASCTIGPYARLRPGTQLESKVKIGNFVEVKKSHLHQGVKVSHLSYVGDAEVGEQSNLGCGFITCNYDGQQKHQTQIGKKTFIGSDCQVIAPIKIGDSCFIAAGSTINKNLESGSFAIARSQQENKKGLAAKFLPPRADQD